MTAWGQVALAETIIHPPPFGAFYWQGSHNGNQIGGLVGNNDPITFTGGGDAGNWERHWIGRYQATGDEGCQSGCQPPTFLGLPPQDGDSLFFKDTFIPSLEGPFSISGGNVSLPSSHFLFEMYANFSGGAYDVQTITVLNQSVTTANYGSVPMNFDNTAFSANQAFAASAVHETLTFDATTIDSPLIELSSVYNYFATEPPPGGTPLILFKGGAQLLGGVIKARGTGRIKTEGAFMRGFGMEIGFQGSEEPTEVILADRSDAEFSQFLIVGKEGYGKLTLESTAKMISPLAYGVIGADGQGFLHITSNSEVELDRLQIGVNKTGDLAIDTGGKLKTNEGILGELAEAQGTANVESSGNWETKKLTVGKLGTGYLYIRDEGTVKITEQGVFGEEAGSHGFLNLIGANSRLEIAQGASLTLGKKGQGILSLSEGAKFTSQGDVKLGEEEGGGGQVSITGSGSVWEVEGDLGIGNGDGAGFAHGEVFVEEGGELKLNSESAVYVGRLEHSQGVLTLNGASSKLTGASNTFKAFEIGSAGTGTLNVEEGFKLSLAGKKLTVGAESTGDGTVKAYGDGTELTTGDLTIGDHGKGVFELGDHAKLTVSGAEMWIGKEQGSDGTLRIQDDNSELAFTGKFSIGDHGKGTLELHDHASLTTDTLTLGTFAGGEGIVSLSDSTSGPSVGATRFETTGELILGSSGKGVLALSGGSRAIVGTSTTLAKETGSHAEVDITGGLSLWSVENDLIIGKAGNATVSLKDGTIDLDSNLVLGEEAGSHGTLFVENSQSGISGVKIEKALTVGKSGQGMLSIVEGGIVDLSGFGSSDGVVNVGQMQNSNGLVIIEGNGSQLAASSMVVGDRGTGSVNVNDHGALLVHTTLELGKENNSHATVEVSGTGSMLHVLGETRVGAKGASTLTITDQATAQLNGALSIGDVSGSGAGVASNVAFTAGANVTATGRDLSIGRGGTLEVSGSEATFAQGRIGGSSSLPATLNLRSAGKVNLSSTTVDHAAVSVDGASELGVIGTLSVNNGSSASVSGGSKLFQLDTLRLGTTGVGTMNLDSGGHVEFQGSSGTFQVGSQGELTMGQGSLVQMNSGAMNIQGYVKMTGGGSSINNPGGIITVGGTLSIRSGSGGILASQINVSPGGYIFAASVKDQIAGRLHGKVKNEGTLVVGQSPGVLGIEGDYEQTSTGVLQLEIGGLTAGDQFDQLTVTGTASIDGLLNLSIINSGSGFQLPSVGDQFLLVDAAGGITGGFDNVASLRSVAGGSLVTWALGSSANQMTLEAASIIQLADGDYNGDGSVDAADYTVWRDTAGGINLAADGNRDGLVNNLDYNVWVSNFGQTAGGGAGAPANSVVPEPATLMLLSLAAFGLCVRRRRAV